MQWNLEFMGKSDEGQAYMDVAKRVEEAIQFMEACGLEYDTPMMTETEFYVSHECLLMEYEQALTRQDSTTGLWCVFPLMPALLDKQGSFLIAIPQLYLEIFFTLCKP